MERVTQYRKLVKSFINEFYTTYFYREGQVIEKMLIEDDTHGQYLIFSEGWKNSSRYYGCSVHIQVRDNGRVWLHHDGTDLSVGQMLLDAGIPKTDLVLGFHSPSMRADTEFAVV